MTGFTFDGIHTSAQNCFYTPDAKARGDCVAEYEVSAIDDEARDGGSFVRARVKPRLFTLNCYFEELSQSKLEEIIRWLRRGRKGR